VLLATQELPGGHHHLVVDVDVRAGPGAPVAAAARGGVGVVELRPEERHPAVEAAVAVVPHRLPFAGPGGPDPLGPLDVERPGDPRGPVPAPHAFDGTVDVEHLEQRLDPGAARGHLGLEGRDGDGPLGGQGGEELVDLVGVGQRRPVEVRPDALVRRGRHQHGLGGVERATGAADRLVVGHRGVGCPEVDDPAELGVVVAHPERRRGDHGLQLRRP
jgi:hypothetical protein